MSYGSSRQELKETRNEIKEVLDQRYESSSRAGDAGATSVKDNLERALCEEISAEVKFHIRSALAELENKEP